MHPQIFLFTATRYVRIGLYLGVTVARHVGLERMIQFLVVPIVPRNPYYLQSI